ncbi:acyl-CoA carboxylase subunit epsilon [Williamsia muralis]|uniref:acyl-CoA carboxylase subunit epsilon n=1 Tax=Williamsia marianensis TaxID=85044 RepID=UPI003822E998
MSADNTPETNAADGTGAAAAARPFLRIVKGNPSDAEIAAVVGVFASAGGSGVEEDPGPRNLWGNPSDRLRAAGGLAPNAFPNLAFGY